MKIQPFFLTAIVLSLASVLLLLKFLGPSSSIYNLGSNVILVYDTENVSGFFPSTSAAYPIEKNWRNLTTEDISKLSNLGRRLFLQENVGTLQPRNYTIHVWKHMDVVKKRFLYRYTGTFYDPFEFCSVRNCRFTSKDEDVTEADAVLFHLHQTKSPPIDIPRTPEQIWVWLSDESPNAIFTGGSQDIKAYNGIFNWSMSYRMDSDVPVPYGRTIPLTLNEKSSDVEKINEGKNKNITLLGSHCHGRNKRYTYVNELKKLIKIDIFGKCGTTDPCPGHFRKNCDVINDYKIYLAFENNNCDDYLSEKVNHF